MLISRVWLEKLLMGGADDAGPGIAHEDAELQSRHGARWTDPELSAAITSLGLEVEGVERVGDGLEAIRVAEVLAIAPHPAADKLRLVTLNAGHGPIEVVCGAPNVPAPGGKVAFAPLGTRLPSGLEIAPREIRGVPSTGMICAEDELGIGTDDSGILILPDDWRAGDRLADRVPGLIDTIFTLSVTPNRPDALGHVGVARDLAVKLRHPFEPGKSRVSDGNEARDLVTLAAPDRCGRYLGRVFADVQVGPSPLWLRVRLHRLGLRPRSNVVDITNLILMEWGQPLHAFDLDALAERRVVVRRARAGERISVIDGRELELDPDDLVIADAVRPQALAGVMGGAESSVHEGTRSILLEAAWFEPAGVRRTARRHQMATDSSHRFERGVDHGLGLQVAAARAGALLQSLAGARCEAVHEVRGELPRPQRVTLRPARCALVLGMEIADEEAATILTGLGVSVDRSDPGRWSCQAPTHRPDLTREEDLIEEIMRHHGLEALPNRPMVPSSAPALEVSPEQRAAEHAHQRHARVVDALCEAGLHEHVSLVFAATEEIEPFADETPIERAVRLKNPLKVQTPYLRTHLLPGLLKAMAINVARHTQPVRLFEAGRVYRWPSPTDPEVKHSEATAAIDRALAEERTRAAILLGPGAGDAHDVGRILRGALERLGVFGEIVPLAPMHARPWLHPGVQAQLARADGTIVGVFGECHPDLLAAQDVPDGTRAYYGELWLDAIPAPDVWQVRPLPRFPSTRRDVSIDLDLAIPASTVVRTLVEAERGLATEGPDPARLTSTGRGQPAIELVEDYRDAGVAPGRRALLLRLAYAAQTRSVTDDEVQRRHEAMLDVTITRLRTVDPAARVR